MSPSFHLLPEECVSNIMSLTSALEACRSSAASPVFRSAADSDYVWERFLPSDYKEIISRAVDPLGLDFASKKELYFRLCNDPILVDDGYMSFALDKWTGKKCYMIGARKLSIAWGDDPHYWRFPKVAELVHACWLKIRGKIQTRMLSPETTYVAKFVYKFAEEVFGFDYQPIDVSVELVGGGGGGGEGGGAGKVQTAYLNPSDQQNAQLGMLNNEGLFRRTLRLSTSISSPTPVRLPQEMLEGQHPQERGDGWLEVEMGEFYTGRGEDGEVKLSVMEVKSGHWKYGLIIQGIELKPKEKETKAIKYV
uniref:F-box protein PP2-B12 n=1 Tax=Nelumbo nucifera TaxID=4432 RepID=A0A822Y2M5_NELNU|nr:TPA_asm: hypothetical protein HUJ06_025351 [Nelumbo nucifera]